MSGKGRAGSITKKKAICLEIKLDILRRCDNGEKAVAIAKAVGLAATTVRTIRDRDGDKIREAAKSSDSKTKTRIRSASMIKMESLLSNWIEYQIAQGIPLSKTEIQVKAKSLFDDLKSKAVDNDNSTGSNKNKNETFEASKGWFERFKVRAKLHNIGLKEEVANADTTAGIITKNILQKSQVSGKDPAGRITTNRRKTINLEMKLDILRRFDKGEKAVDIAKSVGIAVTTVRTMRNRDGDKIIEAGKSATSSDAKTMTRTRSALMIKMESLLSNWIEYQVTQGITISKMIIQMKAKSLFDDLKSEAVSNGHASGNNTEKNETFEASKGWFERFKVRGNLQKIGFKGEAARADITAANCYPSELKALIHEGGYAPKQVFNVDETGLFWKRLPNRTFISKTEKFAPGFKSSKDRMTLLLGGNSNGDFKFKPFVIYESENPRAMKGFSKDLLPVHWRANKKACMTASLFQNWVSTCAIPEIKAYCNKENLEFKALVIIDNAPGHPVYVDDLSENVKFVFLPPNTTSVIQPMNQGIISIFKSYYLRRTFKLLLSDPYRQDKHNMLEFWNKFNIMNAIEIISDSWEEIKSSCMNDVWRKIWPECVHRICAAELDEVRYEISNLARESNFEGMEENDINELLISHNQELSKKERQLQQELQIANEDSNDNDRSKEEEEEEQNLTSKHISKAMFLIDQGMEIFLKNDPDSARSFKVSQAVAKNMNCYKEIYLSLKNKTVHPTLNQVFVKEDRFTTTATTDSSDSDYDIFGT